VLLFKKLRWLEGREGVIKRKQLGLAQVVEYLLSKCKALNSNLSTTKKEKKNI
jgi:hypothetical protein